jgi:hypothetical protein
VDSDYDEGLFVGHCEFPEFVQASLHVAIAGPVTIAQSMFANFSIWSDLRFAVKIAKAESLFLESVLF